MQCYEWLWFLTRVFITINLYWVHLSLTFKIWKHYLLSLPSASHLVLSAQTKAEKNMCEGKINACQKKNERDNVFNDLFKNICPCIIENLCTLSFTSNRVQIILRPIFMNVSFLFNHFLQTIMKKFSNIIWLM